jgi:hypothetical protein
MSDEMICARCGSIGVPDRVTRGGCLIELVLWCFMIVPGLIYSIWRRSAKPTICKSCGSTELVPLNSPVGRELANRYAPKT